MFKQYEPTRSLKIHVALCVLTLCATACGTEVGNGRRPSKPDVSTTVGSPDNASAPSSETGTTPTGTSNPGSPATTAPAPGKTIKPNPHMFVPCASPAVDMTTAAFTSVTGTSDFTVTKNSNTNWSLVFDSKTYTAVFDANANQPFAIQALSIAPTGVTCTNVSSVTSATGATRTAVYSDGFKTTWTVDLQSRLLTAEVINASGVSEDSWKLK